MQAQKQWSIQRYGYDNNWSDDMYAVVLFQLYKKMGGQEEVPLIWLDKYFDPKSNTGIVDFLTEEILDMAA